MINLTSTSTRHTCSNANPRRTQHNNTHVLIHFKGDPHLNYFCPLELFNYTWYFFWVIFFGGGGKLYFTFLEWVVLICENRSVTTVHVRQVCICRLIVITRFIHAFMSLPVSETPLQNEEISVGFTCRKHYHTAYKSNAPWWPVLTPIPPFLLLLWSVSTTVRETFLKFYPPL